MDNNALIISLKISIQYTKYSVMVLFYTTVVLCYKKICFIEFYK